MTEAVYRLQLTSDQLFAERVHLGLSSPVTMRSIRVQRVTFAVLGAVLLLLGLLLLVLVPLGPDGQPTEMDPGPGIIAIVLALLLLVFAVLAPGYYRLSLTALERRAFGYLGDPGAHVELSPAGLALDAPARSVRIGWGYYDDVAVLDTGLELRRRGGPVGFYPVAAFGSEPVMWQAADDVRRWIAIAHSPASGTAHADGAA